MYTCNIDTLPTKDRGTLNTQESLIEVYLAENETQTVVGKFYWSTKILGTEYKPAVLNEVIKICESLNQEEQHQLIQVLQKYEHIFDGIVGEFNRELISLQLMDKETKPVNMRPFTVPRSVEQQLCKEIGVPEEDYAQLSNNFHIFLEIEH